ncbi:hypothetical protein [Rhodococcus sp. ARC_M6]|uniref:hypothetical protein n=1 Tax=Rhodococcus sp. ARC_M6 TaxID=2928852 RepID=UPI001FB2C843|nr:hypothetical protein [Rhodococcus sp. ARC_M6]MCJ0904755.1 hypothetical protein [Rhodococcus sp. ARC_M6]
MEDTASRGINAFISEVTQRGGKAVRLTHSRRNPVEVKGGDGSTRIVRVRSKLDGDWQARRQDEDIESDDTRSEFWVFVDLAVDPHQFFMLPSVEVADDIRSEVDLWIMDSPGRTRTGHHAIPRGRVVHGHDRWDALGLAAVKDTSIHVEAPVAAKRTATPVVAKKRRASAAVEEIEVIDLRLEVTADCHGYRWVGRFDETTEILEVMRGPMEGRRFPNPTAAANAVTGHISGDIESYDGWAFWTIGNSTLGARRRKSA